MLIGLQTIEFTEFMHSSNAEQIERIANETSQRLGCERVNKKLRRLPPENEAEAVVRRVAGGTIPRLVTPEELTGIINMEAQKENL